LCERSSASRGFLGDVDIATDSFKPAFGDALFQQFQASGKACQQIIEVVGDASGELPDRFHFLGLPQGFRCSRTGHDEGAVRYT
jgi:hypothetical protein